MYLDPYDRYSPALIELEFPARGESPKSPQFKGDFVSDGEPSSSERVTLGGAALVLAARGRADEKGVRAFFRRNKNRTKLVISLFIYCGVMAMCLYFMLSGKILVLFEFVQRIGWLGWLLFSLFLIVVSIPTVPGYIPVCLSGGFIYRWYALLIIIPVINICANTVYWIFRTKCSGKKFLPKTTSAYSHEFAEITKTHPYLCIVAVRISAVPYSVVNLWCALVPVPWLKFAGVSVVSMLFDQITSVSVGSGLSDLRSALKSTSGNKLQLALTIVQIIVTVLITIGAGIISSRVYKRLKLQNEEKRKAEEAANSSEMSPMQAVYDPALMPSPAGGAAPPTTPEWTALPPSCYLEGSPDSRHQDHHIPGRSEPPSPRFFQDTAGQDDAI